MQLVNICQQSTIKPYISESYTTKKYFFFLLFKLNILTFLHKDTYMKSKMN